MANLDNPHGLLFVGMDGPGIPLYQDLLKLVGYGTALYPGDAVARVDSGAIQIPATPGTTLISGVNETHGLASTATTHKVLVSRNALFEAQDNNDTDGIAAADLGLNANLEYNAGDATALKSGHEIDESTADVTATLDVHLRELLNQPDNSHGANARIIISINKHRYAEDQVGI